MINQEEVEGKVVRVRERKKQNSGRENKHAEEMFIDSEHSKLSKHSEYVILVLAFCLCHEEIYDEHTR